MKFISKFIILTSIFFSAVYANENYNYEIECTETHRFYKNLISWKLGGEFSVGDTILCYVDEIEMYTLDTVKSIEVINKTVPVYSLEVPGSQCYITNNILSHNVFVETPPIGVAGSGGGGGQGGNGCVIIIEHT